MEILLEGRDAYAHPSPRFCYFGSLLIGSLQVAQKVTHVECFFYLQKRPVASNQVLAASLIQLLNPIAAAGWPKFQSNHFIYSFLSCKPTHYYCASTWSNALYFETMLGTICKQGRYIIRFLLRFLGIHGVSFDCVYICLQVIITVDCNSAPVVLSHILGIFL